MGFSNRTLSWLREGVRLDIPPKAPGFSSNNVLPLPDIPFVRNEISRWARLGIVSPAEAPPQGIS